MSNSDANPIVPNRDETDLLRKTARRRSRGRSYQAAALETYLSLSWFGAAIG